ncbi:MAG: hypothetical protein BMS9Abin02_1977 [Anaerolineae bacterium]|nr:MAG: hypothetical protein BMS9Abin02_1977 [Anaerolineae bacterium]
MLPDDWCMRIEELVGNSNEISMIKKERIEIGERLRKLALLYRDLMIDDIEYREKRKELQSRLDSLIIPENPQLIEAGSYLEVIGDLWSVASIEERRDLTRIMIDAVYIDVIEEKIIMVKPVKAFKLMLTKVCDSLEDVIVS